MIGRPLKPSEVVHHKDGDKTNYAKDNLLVFVSNSDHIRFHHTGEYVETNEKNVVYSPQRPPIRCRRCGAAVKYSKTNLCLDCWHYETRKVERPSKAKLEELIQKYSFVKLGDMFGVSDKAIRKWCDSYQIDYRELRCKK